MIFKADVVSDTPDAIYLEGIYVNPNERGKGYGSRCMSQLVRSLLKRTKAIVLFVNEEHQAAQSFFQGIGFTRHGLYETIFLREQNQRVLTAKLCLGQFLIRGEKPCPENH